MGCATGTGGVEILDLVLVTRSLQTSKLNKGKSRESINVRGQVSFWSILYKAREDDEVAI